MERISAASNIPVNTIQLLEEGVILPETQDIIKLADLYNVSIDYLIGRI